MKRFLTMGIASLLALSMMAGYTSATAVSDSTNSVTFDFEMDNAGFAPIYADYPAGEGVEEFYEFQYDYGKVPIEGAGNGIFISGNNHSDDLFMGYMKVLEGLTPSRTYHFTVSFKLATNVEGGMIGVGGSPGASVYVKGGVTAEKPQCEPDDQQHYRLNIDKGNQGTDGRDMRLLGNLEKEDAQRPGEYEWKVFSFSMQAKANDSGCVYLIIGTDSGFEATSSYYLDDISITWEEVAQQPMVTRGQAAQMLFSAADRPSTDLIKCPFRDVAQDNPHIDAITWAQEHGYLSGYGNNLFGPEDSMTIEQAMVMIYRVSSSPTANQSVLNRYEDGGQVSAWAKDAVAWTIANEVFQPDSTISPQEPITIEALTACLGQIGVAH